MKLSQTMLNALGYIYDREGPPLEKRIFIGMVTNLGFNAALKNNLIRTKAYEYIGNPCFEVVELTKKGKKVGAIGSKVRATDGGWFRKEWKHGLVEAQELLDGFKNT